MSWGARRNSSRRMIDFRSRSVAAGTSGPRSSTTRYRMRPGTGFNFGCCLESGLMGRRTPVLLIPVGASSANGTPLIKSPAPCGANRSAVRSWMFTNTTRQIAPVSFCTTRSLSIWNKHGCFIDMRADHQIDSLFNSAHDAAAAAPSPDFFLSQPLLSMDDTER